MKNILFSPYMYCVLFSAFFYTGCEDTVDQTQSTGQNWPITVRTELDECSDCPIDCCCCGIELVNGTNAMLEFCGLCEGDYLCGTYSPGSPCSTVSGIGKNMILQPAPGHVREVFCVTPGASFRIRNASSNAVTIKFTCQYDVTPNTFTTITLQSGESRFFYNDGSCITAECH